MWIKSLIFRTFVVAGAVVGFVSDLHAAPLNFELTEFTGTNSRVHVLVEQVNATTLQFTLTQPVQAGEFVAEFRAFYFQVADESILGSLVIAGADITNQKIAANAVEEVTPPPSDNDTNLNGGGTNYLLDVGVAFGTNGADVPLITSTIFTLSSAGGLDLATFFPTGADTLLFGARLKPFETVEGSSKLVCNAPCGSSSSNGGPDPQEEIPSPAPLALLGFGLLALAARYRRVWVRASI